MVTSNTKVLRYSLFLVICTLRTYVPHTIYFKMMVLFKWIYFYSYWWNIFWRDTRLLLSSTANVHCE